MPSVTCTAHVLRSWPHASRGSNENNVTGVMSQGLSHYSYCPRRQSPSQLNLSIFQVSCGNDCRCQWCQRLAVNAGRKRVIQCSALPALRIAAAVHQLGHATVQ
jgi:hypothetical protein